MSKTQTPTKSIIIYGIEIASTKMEARLPLGKVEKIRTHLLNMQSREQTNLRDLQSLIGLLNFACSVVVPGRAFLRRLIDLTCGVQNQDDLIDLTDETKSDNENGFHFWPRLMVNLCFCLKNGFHQIISHSIPLLHVL